MEVVIKKRAKRGYQEDPEKGGKSKMKMGFCTQKQIEEEDKKFPFTYRLGTMYLTVKDIMEWLPVKASTVKGYLRNGKMRGQKIGQKWYVTRENFYRFLEGK